MVKQYCCGFCTRTFEQDEAQPTCNACPLKGGCQAVRCPHCGYENPIAPQWLERVRAWFATPAARDLGYDASGNMQDQRAGSSINRDEREAACR